MADSEGSIWSVMDSEGNLVDIGVVSREDFICDFCGEKPTCEYPCENFSVVVEPGPELSSEGAWCACDPCADLIDAGHIKQLTERAVRMVEQRQGVRIPDVIRVLTTLQYRAFAQRRGERQEIQ